MADQYKFNPFTGQLDDVGDFSSSGGTITGDVTFPVTGFLMTDSSGNTWRVTINTSGAIVTTLVITGPGGWLSLGFTNFDV